jgi:hypothetical protein
VEKVLKMFGKGGSRSADSEGARDHIQNKNGDHNYKNDIEPTSLIIPFTLNTTTKMPNIRHFTIVSSYLLTQGGAGPCYVLKTIVAPELTKYFHEAVETAVPVMR